MRRAFTSSPVDRAALHRVAIDVDPVARLPPTEPLYPDLPIDETAVDLLRCCVRRNHGPLHIYPSALLKTVELRGVQIDVSPDRSRECAQGLALEVNGQKAFVQAVAIRLGPLERYPALVEPAFFEESSSSSLSHVIRAR